MRKSFSKKGVQTIAKQCKKASGNHRQTKRTQTSQHYLNITALLLYGSNYSIIGANPVPLTDWSELKNTTNPNKEMTVFGDFIEDVTGLIAVCLVMGLVLVAGQRIPRTKGRAIKWHIIYAPIVLASFFLMPMSVKEVVFTPLCVVVAGTGKYDRNCML